MIEKAETTLTVTSPASSVLPGSNILLTVTADNEEVSVFNAVTGTLYTAEGLVVKVSADAVIGKDSITVTVTSNESENYKAAEAEITLKVEMPPDLTQELADAQAALDKAIADGDEAIKEAQKNLNDLEAALEKAAADNKAALEAKDRELQTFIIIVCVISGVAFCGCGTLGVFYFLDKRKKTDE